MEGENNFPINKAIQNYMLVGGVVIIILGFLLAMLGTMGKSLSIITFGIGIIPLGTYIVGGALILIGASAKQEDQIYRAALIIGGVMLLNGLSQIAGLLS